MIDNNFSEKLIEQLIGNDPLTDYPFFSYDPKEMPYILLETEINEETLKEAGFMIFINGSDYTIYSKTTAQKLLTPDIELTNENFVPKEPFTGIELTNENFVPLETDKIDFDSLNKKLKERKKEDNSLIQVQNDDEDETDFLNKLSKIIKEEKWDKFFEYLKEKPLAAQLLPMAFGFSVKKLNSDTNKIIAQLIEMGADVPNEYIKFFFEHGFSDLAIKAIQYSKYLEELDWNFILEKFDPVTHEVIRVQNTEELQKLKSEKTLNRYIFNAATKKLSYNGYILPIPAYKLDLYLKENVVVLSDLQFKEYIARLNWSQIKENLLRFSLQMSKQGNEKAKGKIFEKVITIDKGYLKFIIDILKLEKEEGENKKFPSLGYCLFNLLQQLKITDNKEKQSVLRSCIKFILQQDVDLTISSDGESILDLAKDTHYQEIILNNLTLESIVDSGNKKLLETFFKYKFPFETEKNIIEWLQNGLDSLNINKVELALYCLETYSENHVHYKNILLRSIAQQKPNRFFLEVAKLVLKKGVNLNEADNEGDTLAHYAANKGNIDLLILLIEYGADITLENNNIDTPFMILAKISQDYEKVNSVLLCYFEQLKKRLPPSHKNAETYQQIYEKSSLLKKTILLKMFFMEAEQTDEWLCLFKVLPEILFELLRLAVKKQDKKMIQNISDIAILAIQMTPFQAILENQNTELLEAVLPYITDETELTIAKSILKLIPLMESPPWNESAISCLNERETEKIENGNIGNYGSFFEASDDESDINPENQTFKKQNKK